LSCDFIYASENAKFGLPEVTLGLIPGFGGTVRLSRRIGIGRARELTYTGEMLSAADAVTMGLANKAVPLHELMAQVMAKAQLIASRAPVAVKHAKQSINMCYDQDIDTAMTTEAAAFAKLFETQDVREGTKAFIEKRKAQFTGS
jgi:enoyl-CoA hydratase